MVGYKNNLQGTPRGGFGVTGGLGSQKEVQTVAHKKTLADLMVSD